MSMLFTRLVFWRVFLTLCAIGIPTATFAQCRAIEVGGSSELLGRFEFDSAYRDCVKVYRNHYLPKHKAKDSDLQLQCRGKQQTIAYFRSGQYFETGIQVAGCALAKTMG
ncbi:hypothetical protein C8J35_1215 [Rhizobium sp. PP-F2F-G38]|nr:hypothetical protein C8J35_1215 [Rhizobium sp. PP-F2F-G38]